MNNLEFSSKEPNETEGKKEKKKCKLRNVKGYINISLHFNSPSCSWPKLFYLSATDLDEGASYLEENPQYRVP